MKKSRKRIIVFCVVILIILGYSYNNFFSKNMLSGVYINVNYKNSPAAETSRNLDTLYIYDDNTFYSRYYSKGSYKLSYSLTGTEISLRYQNSGYHTFVTRDFFGKPKIVLFWDINHYYIKISGK